MLDQLEITTMTTAKKSHANHELMRNGWRNWAAREVVVTVEPGHDLGQLRVDFFDGCNGESRGSRSMTLAHVEWRAMGWITYTLVMPDGSRTEHKGWLHPDFDAVSTPEADAAETTRRRALVDAHPRNVDLDWACYEIAEDYRVRGLNPHGSMPVQPTRPRPTQAEIDASPL
jgi:hypothetical protein